MNAVMRMTDSELMALRVPPQAVDSEQSLLGGLMLDPHRIEAVSEKLSEVDFYRKDHRLIYRAMLELSARGTPCDGVTMDDWLESNGLVDMAGGRGYCTNLANTTPSAANVTAYAAIIREKSVLRAVIDQATRLLESAWSSEVGAVELLDRGITQLMAMQKVEIRSEYTLRQAMTMAFAEAERAKSLGGRIPGIASGLAGLDRILGGWHDSDLVVIGARPAQGKTALLLNFATACSLPCGIISAEQPAQQIGARVLSIKSQVPADRMRNGRFEGSDLRKLENAVGELCDHTCLIYDRSSPTIADVSRMARKWKQQSGIRVLFVDYVQRIECFTTNQRANKAEKVGEVVRGLKNLARDLEIPVIALAQVGRQAEGRQPGMGDLSDSSEIEKEADQILTLFRPGTSVESDTDFEALISVEKNRHGPCGEVRTAWTAETMRFTDHEDMR